MYYGMMTPTLKRLYKKYKEKWNCEPDCYEELEYGNSSYMDYVKDIKKALQLGVELPDLYPDDDEF